MAFAYKLSLAISLLTLFVTGISLSYLYARTREMAFVQIQERLKEISRAGVLYFDADQRGYIKNLSRRVESGSLLDTAEKQARLGELTIEDSLEILPKALSDRIMKEEGFRAVVQSLRKVREATRQQVRPLHSIVGLYEMQDDEPLIEFVFMFHAAPGYPDGKYIVYIADTDPEPLDLNGNGVFGEEEDFPGNPPGNLVIPPTPEMIAALDGEVLAESEFNTDKWGTWLSGYAPIRDENGAVLAVLGVDFNVSHEANQLTALRDIALIMVAAALALSVLLGFLFARILSNPIKILREGAGRVAGRDFSTRIEVNSRDELGQLADAFNIMVHEIQKYSRDLKDLNQVRALLERSNELKTEIIAKVNHELQTPLLGVLANLDILKQAIESEDLNKSNEVIARSVNYCIYQRTLINNMIYATVSDIHDPFYVDREDTADLASCVRQADDLIKDIHDGELIFETPTPSVFVPCQQEILMIVLVNVLSNCAEHSVRTRVRWEMQEGRIQLMAESQAEEMVDLAAVFEKWTSTRKDKTKPILGLGMNIARGLVEKIGGEISADSGDKRFTLRIVFPLAGPVPV